MKDYWHFMTKEGDIFTTRGNIHPEGKLLSVGVYCLDDDGERDFLNNKYKKSVDEFGNKWIGKKYPSYVEIGDLGSRVFVPIDDIKLFFNPFSVSNDMRGKMEKTMWGKLINVLERFVPKKDIGFIGSYLIGFPQENSDIDIVVRGVDNLKIIRDNFRNILNELDAYNNLDESRLGISLKKYNSIYSSKNNNFRNMIKNRWPTVRTDEYMTKIRFSIDSKELSLPEIRGSKIKNIEVLGDVIDDLGTNFMPRFFKIKCDNEFYDVLTYFWDYTYCVKNGDKVKIRGNLFQGNNILLCDRRKHGILFY
jgi:predicted nucleotidyltransferase